MVVDETMSAVGLRQLLGLHTLPTTVEDGKRVRACIVRGNGSWNPFWYSTGRLAGYRFAHKPISHARWRKAFGLPRRVT